jgi:hypothetical protein
MAKKMLSDTFHLLRPKSTSHISFPIFVFNSIKDINVENIKSVIISMHHKSIFFVYSDDNYVFVPMSKNSMNFFTSKRTSNIVVYNCDIEKIEENNGKIVALFYQENKKENA